MIKRELRDDKAVKTAIDRIKSGEFKVDETSVVFDESTLD